jgi:hypothetical protein
VLFTNACLPLEFGALLCCSFFICSRLHVLSVIIFYVFNFILGVRIGLFTPDRAFEHVCKQQIKRLREPALKLCDLVVQEVTSIVRDTLVKVIIFIFTILHRILFRSSTT